MELIDEIEELIMMHQEGSYWDFKREWYDDSKDGDLLIDIICMANNLVDRDAYIIIGVNEECDYAIHDVSQDANRRNTQMLTDFIRGKKFAGDFRPVVTVEQVHLDGGLVDVIVVHNSINTPYYLKEKYDNRFPAVHIWMFDPQYWHRALRLVGRLTICDWQKQRDMRV